MFNPKDGIIIQNKILSIIVLVDIYPVVAVDVDMSRVANLEVKSSIILSIPQHLV